jgi:hypothetical protein
MGLGKTVQAVAFCEALYHLQSWSLQGGGDATGATGREVVRLQQKGLQLPRQLLRRVSASRCSRLVSRLGLISSSFLNRLLETGMLECRYGVGIDGGISVCKCVCRGGPSAALGGARRPRRRTSQLRPPRPPRSGDSCSSSCGASRMRRCRVAGP